MRGKFVNLSLGILNIIFGILILIFQFYVPQNLANLTVQEAEVTNIISLLIKSVLIVLSVINSIALYNNRMESGFKSAYKITLLTLAYYILPKFIIAIFPILGGIMVIDKIMKERLIELDSMFALSINILVFVIICILILGCFIYKDLGQYLYKKQNKDELSYSDTFFKYITELDNNEVYICFKGSNGKYRIYKSIWGTKNRF